MAPKVKDILKAEEAVVQKDSTDPATGAEAAAHLEQLLQDLFAGTEKKSVYMGKTYDHLPPVVYVCACACVHTHLTSHMCNRLTRPGYVDDPRNTDNAWVETCAYHFHCSRELGGMLLLDERKTGKQGMGAKWVTMDESDPNYVAMYANHKQMVEQVPTRQRVPTAAWCMQVKRAKARYLRSIHMAGAREGADALAGRLAHDGGQVGQGRSLRTGRPRQKLRRSDISRPRPAGLCAAHTRRARA